VGRHGEEGRNPFPWEIMEQKKMAMRDDQQIEEDEIRSIPSTSSSSDVLTSSFGNLLNSNSSSTFMSLNTAQDPLPSSLLPNTVSMNYLQMTSTIDTSKPPGSIGTNLFSSASEEPSDSSPSSSHYPPRPMVVSSPPPSSIDEKSTNDKNLKKKKEEKGKNVVICDGSCGECSFNQNPLPPTKFPSNPDVGKEIKAKMFKPPSNEKEEEEENEEEEEEESPTSSSSQLASTPKPSSPPPDDLISNVSSMFHSTKGCDSCEGGMCEKKIKVINGIVIEDGNVHCEHLKPEEEEEEKKDEDEDKQQQISNPSIKQTSSLDHLANICDLLQPQNNHNHKNHKNHNHSEDQSDQATLTTTTSNINKPQSHNQLKPIIESKEEQDEEDEEEEGIVTF